MLARRDAGAKRAEQCQGDADQPGAQVAAEIDVRPQEAQFGLSPGRADSVASGRGSWGFGLPRENSRIRRLFRSALPLNSAAAERIESQLDHHQVSETPGAGGTDYSTLDIRRGHLTDLASLSKRSGKEAVRVAERTLDRWILMRIEVCPRRTVGVENSRHTQVGPRQYSPIEALSAFSSVAAGSSN